MTRPRHTSWIDMRGRTCGSWLVLHEVPSINGTARWLAQHLCKARGEAILDGVYLRQRAPKFCDKCRVGRRGLRGRLRPSEVQR